MKNLFSIILIILFISGCNTDGSSDGTKDELGKQKFKAAAQSYVNSKYNEKIEMDDVVVKFDGKRLHYFEVYAHPVGAAEYKFRILMNENYLSDDYPEVKWGIQARTEITPIFKKFLSENASLKDIHIYSSVINDNKHEVNVPEYSELKNEYIKSHYTEGLIRQNFYIEMRVLEYDKNKELKKVLDLILLFQNQGISIDLLEIAYPKWKIKLYDREVISNIKNLEELKKNQFLYN